ncbi:phage integrase [Octadecabacter antarcticus 307]|uniref:Phage integrase n=1 Tax=Octadecabacter antarcticus 307 TaxID=391626 RepID=M9RF49_9RHOB|nr:site-specific integrase [Octadecabacter antarcticus]AGI69016.1 phage integrase [Octadecabacter antarcticus 307]
MADKKSLTANFIKTVKKPGRYYDTNSTGLHLYVRKTGSKSWVQRLTVNGKIIDIGLGSSVKLLLLEARTESLKNSKLASEGIDPRQTKVKGTAIPTFRQVTDSFIEKKKGELSNAKHLAQWRSTLSSYAHPTMGNLPVNEVTIDHIFMALKPIWLSKNETAQRTRGRIEGVLNFATTKGYRTGSNPAIWRGNLENLLPKPSKVQNRKKMPALQLLDMPRWWAELKQRDGTGAKALMFLTLVGSRSGEIRGMRHGEVEFFTNDDAAEKGYLGLWTIPASRMKAKVEHCIPIIRPVYEFLSEIPHLSDFVFPSSKGGELSDMTLSALMKRMHKSDKTGYFDKKSGQIAVPHGIRSTFRDWAGENEQPRDATELQLAHRIGNKVEQAYFRADLLKIRAKILMDWYKFLEGHK